ncbi:hypothetical protein BurJ1DRAFT_0592 [Burkholderiales bacterium JOSHI_001]|nr:hypothetical protein BurJ1DRAFT_0592 [Burkholderiales bacterium JOSHI_001]
MPTKRKPPAPPPKKKAPAAAAGPLTLEQARAIAGVSTEPVASAATAARRGAAPRRAPRGGLGAADASTSTATPATVAIERRKLAIDDREQRTQRLRDYKSTMALLQSRGVKGLPAAPPTQPGRRRAPGAPGAAAVATGPLRIIAEGDSWFDYPVPFFGGGLVPRLESRLGVPILNLAKAGDETRFMLGVEQRQLIARHFRDGCPDGTPWELMLFSGGGNDIVAQPLALWLNEFNPSVPPAKLLNQARFSSALALVRAAYEDLIAIRDLVSPTTQLAFHGYDFAIPDGRGICHMGPWLKPAFDLHGFPPDLMASSAVVREMLMQLAAMLKALESHPRVSFISAQGTLAAVKSSWHNEMHPSRGGFNQIADKFHAAIRTMFPGRVLV